MANTVNFYSASYDKIQSYIDSGTIGAYSYILCKDDIHKNELIFIDKDLQMQPIVGYEQNNLIFVDELPTEQYRTNAFYICNNIGYLYINGIPVPVFKDISKDSDLISSYNELEDLPVVNKYGEVSSPVILCELDNGSYSINGHYQIGGNLTTTYVPSKKVIILIDSDEENKYITKLDAKKVCTYMVHLASMEVVEEKYTTEKWVLEQGYTTKNYVDEAIDALYKKIASEALVTITKLSQLENDMGYITRDELSEVGQEEITNLFLV